MTLATTFAPTAISSIMRNDQIESERKRRHFIPEWAERKNLRQTDIVRELGVEKSVVYRWFSDGVIPTEKYLSPLAELLGAPEVVSLFRHPDDDWLSRMFIDKTETQKERAIQMLKIFFEQQSSDASSTSNNGSKAR